MNNSFLSNQEKSTDYNNNFRPILENIPMRILKESVPQAKLMNINQKKVSNKFDNNNGNNSFMVTSFEKLNPNGSFTHDYKNNYGSNRKGNKKKLSKKLPHHNNNNNKYDSPMVVNIPKKTSNDYSK